MVEDVSDRALIGSQQSRTFMRIEHTWHMMLLIAPRILCTRTRECTLNLSSEDGLVCCWVHYPTPDPVLLDREVTAEAVPGKAAGTEDNARIMEILKACVTPVYLQSFLTLA